MQVDCGSILGLTLLDAHECLVVLKAVACQPSPVIQHGKSVAVG